MKPTFKHFLALTLLTLSASAAQAERSLEASSKHQLNLKGNFTRHSEQQATGNGFIRNTQVIRADGATASRTTRVENDPDNQTRTRLVNGVNFQGEAYSAQAVTQRTESGYTREASATNAQGKTVSRSVTADVDAQSGTVTKNIALTGPNGEVKSRQVVSTRQPVDNSPDANQANNGQADSGQADNSQP